MHKLPSAIAHALGLVSIRRSLSGPVEAHRHAQGRSWWRGLLPLASACALSHQAMGQTPQNSRAEPASVAHIAPGALRFTYLGNAGWEITDGRTVILVDPIVSQFASHRLPGGAPPRLPDDLLTPDTAGIDQRIKRADYVLITHGHWDHTLDAPYIARKTGAVIIGNESVANLARASNVADSSLIIVRGGEDFEFGNFSLKVIPSLHSALFNKRYYTVLGSGQAPRGLRAPLRRKDYQEGSTFAYLLRLAGHQVLIMGGMNYIEREMEGLRPDIALIGAIKGIRGKGISGGTTEIYDYAGRLMRALGHPRIVFPTHLDAYGNPASQVSIAEARRQFAEEIQRISPATRVISPIWFDPVVIDPLR